MLVSEETITSSTKDQNHSWKQIDLLKTVTYLLLKSQISECLPEYVKPGI